MTTPQSPSVGDYPTADEHLTVDQHPTADDHPAASEPTAAADRTAQDPTQEPAHDDLPEEAGPSRGRRFGSRLWGPLLLVAGCAAALFVAAQASKEEPAAASAGSCLHALGTSASSRMTVVDCTKAEAEYKVIQVFRDATHAHPCDSVLGLGVFGSYTEERKSSIVTLCLGLNGDRPGGPIDDIPVWAKEH
ncbi:hypothetical protein OH807_39600 [Kitasatospora sp. NBC_01560]|uniref:LppU/SCO3897 family protein n=1 Tax=Kitasatospora sp. NBC_01560 TaxID=2975965 RepID=UPI00386F13D7